MKQRVKETLLSQFDPSFASFAICQWHGYSHIFLLNELKTQSNDSKSKKMSIEFFTSD